MNYTSTPVQEISHETLEQSGVKLFIKREDLNHQLISGNKWWKLKYNMLEAMRLKHQSVLTFGGAFSNHIYATAAAAAEFKLQSIGIIRGEPVTNDTLDFAKKHHMLLEFMSRDLYRKKNEKAFIDDLHKRHGEFYLIPEGGTNHFAIKGCEEFGESLLSIDFDYACLPVGTGGTIAGIISGLKGHRKVVGYPVLKDAHFLYSEIEALVSDYCKQYFDNWQLQTQYHFGGYAKHDSTLRNFINEMEPQLPLEHVYTAKLIYGILEDVKSGFYPKGCTILSIHTGGLQGKLKQHG